MMFRGLETGKTMRLSDLLPHRRGQIISHNLVQNNRCDMRMFSFDAGEEVGLQTSKADILYWVLEGEASLELEGGGLPLRAGQVVVAGRGLSHGIGAVTAMKMLQISVFEREKEMEHFIKNIDHGKVLAIDEILSYETNKVASMTLAQNEKMSLTLMSFDKGEGISTHASGGDAMVQVLDGAVEITIDQERHSLNKGDAIVMPANVPHSLKAIEPFKMLLVVVKP